MRFADRSGFTLVEVVVALGLLAGVLLSGAGLCVMGTSASMTGGSASDPDSALYVLIGVGSLTSAISQWLAFFPPRSYRGWVQRRGEASSQVPSHG